MSASTRPARVGQDQSGPATWGKRWDQARQGAHPRRAGVRAMFLAGSLVVLAVGNGAGQGLLPDPARWAGWLEAHRAIEYGEEARIDAGPSAATVAAWLQAHHRIEYGRGDATGGEDD
jgi:hypothetical protein